MAIEERDDCSIDLSSRPRRVFISETGTDEQTAFDDVFG